MMKITDYPLLVFALSFALMWFSAWLGPVPQNLIALADCLRAP